MLGYDAAGNVTSYGTASYTYDAENRLIATAGMSYIYDGDGKRVEKCTAGTVPGACAANATGTLYFTGTGNDALVETDLSGNVLSTYIFFNGRRVARRDTSGTTFSIHSYFSDHLGTHSIVTDANGTMPPQYESDYFPYGGEIPITNGDTNHFKFIGKERDSETCGPNSTCLDYFVARDFGSAFGRFLSADPGNAGADPSDPQSWNAYSYVGNNPLNLIDSSGLVACIPGAGTVLDGTVEIGDCLPQSLAGHWAPCPNDSTVDCWKGDKPGEIDPKNGTVWNGFGTLLEVYSIPVINRRWLSRRGKGGLQSLGGPRQ
jgi:RHS repeat-associated protein